jgi:diguanylate cyclase (GGDEF)-like protein/PAS domain S-box-containing protein
MAKNSLTDIQVSATTRLIEALQESENQMHRRINLLVEIVFELNGAGEIVYLNDAWQKQLGYSVTYGTQLSDYIHPFDLEIYQKALNHHTFNEGQQSQILVRFKHRDGRLLSMNANLVSMKSGIVGALHDVTEHIQTRNDLVNLAHFDPLTKLPNRLLLEDRLKQSIIYAKRHNQLLAVVFVDLDNFSFINNNYGHRIGDEILKEFGHLIQSTLRETDSIARIGGDEFLILLSELTSPATCDLVLQRLVEALRQPIVIGGVKFLVRASIGVSLYPDDDTDTEQLIRNADHAMYSAKQSGKNKIEYFDAARHATSNSRIALIQQVKKALVENQFVMHYQPKVTLRDKRIFGVEALIRWQHPENGLLLPGLFLPQIEKHPLSQEIGKWAIETSLKQMSEWNEAGLNLEMNVNIGGAQLHDLNFYDFVANALKKIQNVKTSQLQLEIVETSAITNIEFIVRLMQNFKQLGVSFALDDFGTGYSSLSLLRILPIDTIKIDKSFIVNMLVSKEDLSIVKSIISLAEGFNCKVLAEGVETSDVAKALHELGCHAMQGHHFSPALPAAEVYKLVSSSSSS